MVLATLDYITDPRLARDAVVKRIQDNNETLHLGYIGKDNEQRLPRYPAIVVTAGGKSKEYHGTHTFAVRLSVEIYVYHANMKVGHATRSDEDLILVENIEDIVEGDMTYGGQFISCYIENIQPGMAQPANSKSDIVIGTRLLWTALSQERFK